MKKLNVQKLTLCGVMAALVFVMTYFPKIPVPVTGGYVHLGDGAIFLSVLLLGPLGIPAAAVGSMLSDLIGSRGDWPECGAGHRGRADWDAVPADYAPAGARGEAVTNRDANGFPLWKTLASFFNDAEKSPGRGQIRRKMCYNSILERDTLSPEAETRCKETLREIVR